MATTKKTVFDAKALNGWPLYWLITILIFSGVLIPFFGIDQSDPAQISEMIQQSVRVAVPWLFLAFAASSLVFLFPNPFTKWMMRNRRILGLLFATGMGWQLFFILWYVFGHTNHYVSEAYSLYDLAEQVPGYIILFAMTITSFKWGRKMLSSRQWRILHTGGIYFLWFVVWGTYWFELFFYNDINPIDYVYYWAGFAAWVVRIAAWAKKQTKDAPIGGLTKSLAAALVATGVYLLIFGNAWTPLTPDTFYTMSLGGWLGLLVPYLPMVPVFAAAWLAGKKAI